MINDGFGTVATRVSGSQGFWQGWGLCGGMTWHALDHFYARNPITAATEVPDRDSPLFRVLVGRQFDSFHGASLLTRCIRWQSRTDTHTWWDPRPTIRALTMREWARVKQSVDQGFPASLTLIRTTTAPWDNHQVLAFGYGDDPDTGRGEILLYDPNHPDQEPKIRITTTGHDAGKANQSSGEPLRGFFVWPYDRTQREIHGGATTDASD